ncbi:lysophospholipid acyltransferase family protein [Bordetella genomosp. 13]|uniref:lysophospholipid acyltransferase family protein n=1 Tax=Bordetella genomosp. 13 TaxID=463040 RepID=UPI0021B56C82|nr:lysophospholipid acyltransferase family protein [Bordetella genomosp. 13]
MSQPGMDIGPASTLPPRQDYWLLRLFTTGFAFAAFGLGGLTLRLTVFPLQRLLYRHPARRQDKARAAVRNLFRVFVHLLVRSGTLTYEFRGVERLGRPHQMIVANHPSLLDVVFLLAHVPDANCIVKHKLATNPFTRGPVRGANYITNNESVEMFDAAVERLQEGETMIVFPEGTRTPRDGMPIFHRGACAIAMRGAQAVTPVVITMNTRSLTKGEPWYRIPRQRLHYVFEVGPDIDPATWTSRHPLPIAGRKMNEHLHRYFESELKKHAATGA